MTDIEKAEEYEGNFDVGEEHGYLYTHRGDIKEAFLFGAEWKKKQIKDKITRFLKFDN